MRRKARHRARSTPAWLFALPALAIPALVISVLVHQSRFAMLGLYRDSTQEPSVVTEVMPGGPAAAAGLQAGDALLSVNGAPFDTGYDRQPGKTYVLEIVRDGRRLTLDVRAVTMAWVMRWQLLAAVLVALAFWAVGTLLLWRRFEHHDVRLLFLTFQATGLALLPSLAYPRFRLPPGWMLVAEYGSLFLAAPLFLHYHLTFPVTLGSQRQRRRVLALLYGLALLAAADGLRRPEPWRSPAAYYIFVVAAGALAAVGFVYFCRASPGDRRRLRVVMAGTFLGVGPPLLGYVLPTFVAGYTPDVPRWLVSLFLAIVPLSYLYATAHHNLFGIDRLLNRTLIYLILSLALFAVYAGPLALLCRYLPGEWLPQVAVVIPVTLVVGLSFDSLRKQVQRWVDTLFYGGWYDYPRVVEQVSDALARSLQRKELASVLAGQVPELMRLDGAQIWIGEEVVQSSHARSPIRSPSLSFRFRCEGRECGTWIVWSRHDEEGFSASDRRILNTLARQAEIALNNVLLVERLQRRLDEIRTVQHRLLCSREEERGRLARDLHDGPIQALVGLNLELALLIAAWEESAPGPARHTETLREMCGEVRSLLHDLRQTCAQLRPPMLDTLGLGAALRALVAEWSAQHDPVVHLELPPDEAIRSLPADVAVNLYRVVQEALSNVARHAAARTVTVSLARASPARTLTLTVRDDGRGFVVPDDLHHLAAEGHFGLVGQSERAALIGGAWTVESAPGQGTTLRLIWPKP